jgi:DHA2 family multidrug resistance protein
MAYRWRASLVVALALFMAVLDNTIVNVALPQMQSSFKTDYQSVIWVITAYFLAQAAVIPITGYLSDRLGSKQVFLASVTFFTIGSALCALSPSIGWLIFFRVLQGLGGGALFPLAFAIVFRLFPPAERGPAAATVGLPVFLAPAIGPTIGGYLTTYYQWPAIFTINVPLGIVAVVLGWWILKADHPEIAASGGGFDIPGLALAMAGTTGLVYGIFRAGSVGLGDSTVSGLLIASLVLLAGFVVYELRRKDPVLDLRLFGDWTFASTQLLNWLMTAVMLASIFLIPFYFENVQGHTALQTGIYLIVMGVGAAAGVALGSQLYNRIGPRPLVVVGIAVFVIGSIGFTTLGVGTDPWSLWPWLLLRGFGFGSTGVPLQNLTLARVSNLAMARASSLVNVTRQIAGAIGVAALTSYLTSRATFHGTQRSEILTQCSGLIRNLPALRTCATKYVEVQALNDTFLVVTLVSLLCLFLSIFLGNDPAVGRHTAEAPRPAAEPAGA